MPGRALPLHPAAHPGCDCGLRRLMADAMERMADIPFRDALVLGSDDRDSRNHNVDASTALSESHPRDEAHHRRGYGRNAYRGGQRAMPL